MPDRYIAFDVETPNAASDRMSAIGITVIEGGCILSEYATLVDPECRFDPFNIALTGITPEAVAGQPAFPALWEAIAPIMESGVLIAHNAPFDLSVLSKCLRGYGIAWKPNISKARKTVATGQLVTPTNRAAVPQAAQRAGSIPKSCPAAAPKVAPTHMVGTISPPLKPAPKTAPVNIIFIRNAS